MFNRVLKNLLSFTLILTVILIAIIWWGKEKFEEPGSFLEDSTFIINPGDSFNIITQRLRDHQLIDNIYVFKFWVIAKRDQKKLKYGEYEFPARSSMNDILALIANGKTKIRKIVIPEGFSNFQIIERLNSVDFLSGDLVSVLEEGSYAPQTYLYSRGDRRDNLLTLMNEKQSKILDNAWKNRALNLPFKNKLEALILASIIEEESSLAEERKIIASVFINRLEKKMKLQTDPSVIYGITRGEYKLGRGLFASELKQYTPWNTYQIIGLPPTPISNPGEASINAVMNPAVTEFLYFVANGVGGHWFAKSNKEHNENVKKWRKIEKSRRDKTTN